MSGWLALLLVSVIAPGTCAVSGTVVDAVTGTGIAGAEVRVSGDERVHLCDDSGRFAIPDLPAGANGRLWWSAPGYCRPDIGHAIVPVAGRVVDGIVLPLLPVPPLVIRVEADGEPLAGAVVLLGADVPMLLPDPDSGAVLLPFGRSRFERRTSGAGTVTYDRLSRHLAESLFVVVQCEGFETEGRAIRGWGDAPQEVVVRLTRAPRRTLRVTMAGRPLGSGTVIFFDESQYWEASDEGETLLGPYRPDLRVRALSADGEATVHARSWPRWAMVSAPEVGLRLVELGELSGATVRECAIEPGPRWEARFVDGEGRPVAGVRVASNGGGGGSLGRNSPQAVTGPKLHGVTDAEGRISLPRVEEAGGWRECRIGISGEWEFADPAADFLVREPRTIVLRPRIAPRLPVRIAAPEGIPAGPTVHVRGASWSRAGRGDHVRHLREKREEYRRSPIAERPSLAEIDRWARRTLDGAELVPEPEVFHVPREGAWPYFAVQRLLGQDRGAGNDLLTDAEGNRAILWGVTVPDRKALVGETVPATIEIRLSAPGS